MVRFALLVASVLGFALMAALGNMIIPLRHALRPAEPRQEQAAQRQEPAEERAEEPQDAARPVPPSLGGLCLMLAALAAAGIGWTAACVAEQELLVSQLTTRLMVIMGGALAFGVVGAADDILRARHRSPLGLRRLPRLALEAVVSVAFLLLLYANGWLATGFTVPGTGYMELGTAAAPLWCVGLVALAECARVSDGADGTVCGTAFVAMLGLMCALTLLGWFELAVFPAALAGALMAFLLWNFPPAKFGPGAAGSLFVAGAVACVSLGIGWPELGLPLCLPFWLEGGMVGLQVVYSRLTHGRQLFCTAPLHRWLEKRGVGAVAVFYIFCALAALGVCLCYYTVAA